MWDLPRPGIEPMSPALAGRFFTIEPPREGPKHLIFFSNVLNFVCVWKKLICGGVSPKSTGQAERLEIGQICSLSPKQSTAEFREGESFVS